MEIIPGRLFTLRLAVVLSAIIVGLTASLTPSAYGQSINLAWDASSDPNVIGYNVYRSQQSGVYPSTPINGSNIATTAGFNDPNVPDDELQVFCLKNRNGPRVNYVLGWDGPCARAREKTKMS